MTFVTLDTLDILENLENYENYEDYEDYESYESYENKQRKKLLKLRILIAAIILCFGCLYVSAQDAETDSLRRPITASYALHIGYGSVLDPYLSPLRYGGEHLAISGIWSKAMPANPKRLLMNFEADIEADFARSVSKNSIYNLGLDFGWDMQYRWQPMPQLQLSAGGGAALYAGVVYLPYNGNNPASARASIDLTLNAAAQWHTHIGKLPIAVIDRVSLPSLGVFFSPEYGESYYEIYLGNRSGLAHVGWWGNHFCLRNLLAADLKLGRHSLRIGYEFNVRSSYVCSINTQLYSHSVIVGFTY